MKTTPRRFFILAVFALLCGSSIPAFSQETKWYTDFAKASTQAKAENKTILLDFTGSDWCPWCQRMDQETLGTQQFLDYAKDNLEWVMVDFLKRIPQPPDVIAQNLQMKEKFQVKGFPTFILINPQGTVLWKQEGYLPGGPDAFIAAIQKANTPSQ